MSRSHQDRIGLASPFTGAAVLAALVLTLSFTVRAQETSGSMVIVEEGAAESGGFLEDHLFGSIGADVFVGSPVSRNLVAARLGVDYPFAVGAGSGGRLYIEGGYARRSVSLEQKLASHVEADSGKPETRELDVSISGAELREAYLQYDLADSFSLSLGYQRPIWGQFDIVSPVNLLLPLEFQSDDLSFEKSAYRMPQPGISALVFPHERLEVSGYWFSETNLDPLYEEILKDADGGDNDVFVPGAPLGVLETRPRPREDLSDYDAHAVRAVWYGDSLTFGLTYYKGRNTLFAFDELPLVEEVSQMGGTSYNVIERSLLPSSQALGFELSLPAGRWTWKGEAFYMQTQADIDGIRWESFADADSGARRDLYEWIVNENGAQGYVDVDLLMIGAGFDAVHDRWRFGASAFVLNTMLDDEAEEADRLVQAAYHGDDGVGMSTVFLPNAYVFRDFDSERTRTLGFVGGFAGPFLGLSTFYSSTWLDNWRWTTSVEYAVAVSDELLNELNSDSGDYELEGTASLGVRLGVLYEF